jgi:hypothetical protein
MEHKNNIPEGHLGLCQSSVIKFSPWIEALWRKTTTLFLKSWLWRQECLFAKEAVHSIRALPKNPSRYSRKFFTLSY